MILGQHSKKRGAEVYATRGVRLKSTAPFKQRRTTQNCVFRTLPSFFSLIVRWSCLAAHVRHFKQI
jgi:hypothetical protein